MYVVSDSNFKRTGRTLLYRAIRTCYCKSNNSIVDIGWEIGFVFEVIADYHPVRNHITNGWDGLLRDDVWLLTRHPNYFGETTLWWGIGLMALANPVWWLL